MSKFDITVVELKDWPGFIDHDYREESDKLEGTYMGSKKICRWYDETSGVKRAYDLGLIEKKWVEEYCWKGGTGCVRKKRFEEEGYVSPDYVLPNGAVSERVKNYLESTGSL